VPRVLMALMFFPRGGSSQVARYLARSLPDAGWQPTLACGSLGPAGAPSNAATFFAGIDVRALDFGAAAEAPDPLAADPPFHPSFEDRPGAPDRVFARLDDAAFEHQVAAWSHQLGAADAAGADLLHLHHLTPINEAAQRDYPDIPRIGHLHGTELLMLHEIADGPPPGWAHAEEWAGRMRAWARGCERLLVLSPDAVRRVPALLDVPAERVVWAPNGFDPAGFRREPAGTAERQAHWHRWLVEEPRGWDESGEPGSVAYRDEDLAAFREGGPVLLYVGRYTSVKRIPLLIRAHARARERFRRRAPLVLLGGFPGEWEGEHPLQAVRETADPDVFLAGWHGHDDLPAGLNAADLLVLPSVHEQFGAVLVEAMACGLPVVAVDAYGPAEIVDDGETGWLVPPDDEEALAAALVEAVNGDDERHRRGACAYDEARARYAWPALARGLGHVYDEVRGGVPAAAGVHTLLGTDRR
jgi:glycosyltransferase involved in cell wall biosynthesis